MNRYGIKDVFDLKIYDKDGLVFDINTVKEMSINRNFDKKENTLTVRDALVDVKLLNDILSGKYDDRFLRIEGKSVFRDLDCVDHNVTLNVTVAKISWYSLPMSCCDTSVVDLEFDFPTLDSYGFVNTMFKVGK